MASTSDIAHKWANQLFGKNGGLCSQNAHCDTTSFYSYSTVIAQWLDTERKIMAVIDLNLTTTTGKHVADVERAITHDTTVFRLHSNKPGYNGFYNVDFCKYNGECDPMAVTRTYINLLYDEIASVPSCNSLNVGNLHWWNELQRFAKLFPGGSVKKWLRMKLNGPVDHVRKTRLQRKMVRVLLNGATFEEVVDVVNSAGTWERYLCRTKGPRKMAQKRAYANKIAKHIGFYDLRSSPYTIKQILALSPYERVCIKLGNIIARSGSSRRSRKKAALTRLYRHFGLPQNFPSYSQYPCMVTNPDTGEVLFQTHPYADAPLLSFDIDRAISDTKRYRKAFFTKAAILNKIHHGARLHMRKLVPETGYDRECLSIYEEVERKREARYVKRKADLDARRKREAEERKAKQLERERAKELYRARGIDGYRDLWRDRFDTFPDSHLFKSEEFYFGGNVLLRYNKDSQMVETSKSISLTVPQANKLWRAVAAWHEKPGCFSRIDIPTKNGVYTAHSYCGDVLIAGCHAIAYEEMERMARQLHFI